MPSIIYIGPFSALLFRDSSSVFRNDFVPFAINPEGHRPLLDPVWRRALQHFQSSNGISRHRHDPLVATLTDGIDLLPCAAREIDEFSRLNLDDLVAPILSFEGVSRPAVETHAHLVEPGRVGVPVDSSVGFGLEVQNLEIVCYE